MGILAGVIHARASGQGQVVDCAMVDGAASLMAMFYGFKARGMWADQREANLLDGGAHFYDTYQCADGKWIAIGAIEPQFYKLMLEKVEITDPAFAGQNDSSIWPELKLGIQRCMRAKTRDEWCAVLEGTDACFAPVLSLEEAPQHPHNRLRGTFVTVEGVVQPGAVPRFSETPGQVQGPPKTPGADSRAILAELGYSEDDARRLLG